MLHTYIMCYQKKEENKNSVTYTQYFFMTLQKQVQSVKKIINSIKKATKCQYYDATT
jgi:hypothetical protein